MNTFLKRFLLFIAVLIMGSTTVSFAQTLATNTNTTVPATVNRTKMLQLVNAVRSKGCQCGDTYYYPAAPVIWNTQLETAAYNHTADMAKNNFFSHTGTDGNRAGNRLERVNYHWKTYGENIGQGYKTENEMIQGWLASPGHCKNIMNKTYTEMGVARVGNLWTQDFGSR